VATVVTDVNGQTTFGGLVHTRSSTGIPSRRYWALGLVNGEWQRVSFS
jgi:hypothetical protein